jgi:hypothetical protein
VMPRGEVVGHDYGVRQQPRSFRILSTHSRDHSRRDVLREPCCW